MVTAFQGLPGASAEPLGQATLSRLQDSPSQPSPTLSCGSGWSLLMPTIFGLLELSEQKPRGDLPAAVSLPQRPQVLGLEEQDVSCEVSRSHPQPRGSSPELEGRHRKQLTLDSLCQDNVDSPAESRALIANVSSSTGTVSYRGN